MFELGIQTNIYTKNKIHVDLSFARPAVHAMIKLNCAGFHLTYTEHIN